MRGEQLRGRLEKELRDAMRSRDQVTIAALRSALSAIANAEAVEGPHRFEPRPGLGAGEAVRRELSGTDVLAIVRAEIADRAGAAAEYERLGRPAEAGRLRQEAAVLESYLDLT